MNSENVDTEPSLQMHKLPSGLFLLGVVGVGGWVGAGYFFFGGGGDWVGYTLHKGQQNIALSMSNWLSKLSLKPDSLT